MWAARREVRTLLPGSWAAGSFEVKHMGLVGKGFGSWRRGTGVLLLREFAQWHCWQPAGTASVLPRSPTSGLSSSFHLLFLISHAASSTGLNPCLCLGSTAKGLNQHSRAVCLVEGCPGLE